MNNNIGNIEAANHVTGKSIYVDDIPVMEGTLYIKVFDSTVAHGIIKSIDFSAAEQMPGIVKIFSYKDVPGENQIGGIIPDEPLLADHARPNCGAENRCACIGRSHAQGGSGCDPLGRRLRRKGGSSFGMGGIGRGGRIRIEETGKIQHAPHGRHAHDRQAASVQQRFQDRFR
jgi:hypothetical protein